MTVTASASSKSTIVGRLSEASSSREFSPLRGAGTDTPTRRSCWNALSRSARPVAAWRGWPPWFEGGSALAYFRGRKTLAMKPPMSIPACFYRRFILAAFGLICVTHAAKARDVNDNREALARMAVKTEAAIPSAESAGNIAPLGFVPAQNSALPVWQYAIMGSGIGASNIIIGPAPVGGGAPEIIVGSNSQLGIGPDDFWQVLRRNAATGNYDQVFVSPLYPAAVKRIAVGNLLGDSRPEIAVMLANGRIYLYDRETKAELGSVITGINGLEGLSVTDLDGDGVAELIVTTANDLFVFSNAGVLLWQVAGAGGHEVVVGQMDHDPALEIAATNGLVVDAATHSVQWTCGGGFGLHLKLAPVPGDTYQQVIAAEEWNWVYAHDVALQWSRRWSIQTPTDIAAIEVADVDNDGIPEVIIGDNQHGTVHVHDLSTQAQKWAINNPDGGVTNIAVGDVDNDGVVDLLWGSGWTNTGPDYFRVASTTDSHAIKWQSVDLQGPFLGPVIGDLDGDGQPELVVCSYKSNSGQANGRILVFDLATLTLRGMSAPVVGSFGSEGVKDFKLRDLEGDGRMEIVLASDRTYNGVIEIYEFSAANVFNLKWTNATRPVGSPFEFVDVVDLDGNGTPEIIAGNSVAHTGSEGVYVYIFDYPNGANPWRSVLLANPFDAVTGLVVDQLAGTGEKKIAALVTNGDLCTIDGRTRQLESIVSQSGGKTLSRRGLFGLIKTDAAGAGHFLQYSRPSYTENFSRQLGSGTPDGMNMLSNGDLWIGSGGALSLRTPPAYDAVDWQSPSFGTGFGRFVATDDREGHHRVFSSAQHAVAGFGYEAATDSVSIGSVVYTNGNHLLRVSAASSIKSIIRGAPVLHVYVTATAAFIGDLTGNSAGTYSGTLSWPGNPEFVTVKSSKGGHADRAVLVGHDSN
jgi:hypothetical protein